MLHSPPPENWILQPIFRQRVGRFWDATKSGCQEAHAVIAITKHNALANLLMHRGLSVLFHCTSNGGEKPSCLCWQHIIEHRNSCGAFVLEPAYLPISEHLPELTQHVRKLQRACSTGIDVQVSAIQ